MVADSRDGEYNGPSKHRSLKKFVSYFTGLIIIMVPFFSSYVTLKESTFSRVKKALSSQSFSFGFCK